MRTALSPTACALALLLALACASPARAARHDLTIANTPTAGVGGLGTGTLVPIADDAVLDVADLVAALANGAVTLDASVDDGDPAVGQAGQVTFADGLDASATAGALTITAAGPITLPAAPVSTGAALTLTAAGALSAPGPLTAGGAVTATAPSIAAGGPLTAAGGGLSLTATTSLSATALLTATGGVTLDAPSVTAAGGLSAGGALHLTATTDLSATGPLTAVGAIDLETASGPLTATGPLTAGAAITLDATGGTLAATGPITAATGALALTAPAISAAGALTATTGALTLDGPVTLAADAALHAGADLTSTSTVDGAHALELLAGGTVALPAAVGALDPPASLHVLGGATDLGVDGTPDTVTTVGDQEYDGAVAVHDVTVAATGGAVAFLGPTLAVGQALTLGSGGTASGTLTGAGRIVRDGTGTFALTGADGDPAAPAAIELRAGTLAISARQHRAVRLLGGRLAGTGPVGAITDPTPDGAASVVAPAGQMIGTLLATGPIDLGPRTTLALDLGALVTDTLAVTGAVHLDGTGLSVTSAPAGLPADLPITVLANDGTDPVDGRFAGLAQGATFSQGGITYKIDYAGGDGNDVTLTRQAPATTTPPPGGGGGTPPTVEPPPTPVPDPVAPAPAPAVTPTPLPRIAVLPTVMTSGRRITAGCPIDGPVCTLKVAGRGSSAALVLTRRTTAAAGARKTVTLTLTARGKRKLRAAGRLRVAFKVTARAGTGTPVTVLRTLTLR